MYVSKFVYYNVSDSEALVVKQPVAQTPSRSGSISRPSSAQSVIRSPSSTGSATIPAAKPRPRPSSLQAPIIAPRPNRSAQLRAAQMEATNAKKPGPRPSIRAWLPGSLVIKAEWSFLIPIIMECTIPLERWSHLWSMHSLDFIHLGWCFYAYFYT